MIRHTQNGIARTTNGIVVGTNPNLIDSWDDGNINEYTVTNNTNETVFTVQSGTTFNSSQALESEATDGSSAFIASDSGLQVYPSAGDSWSVRQYRDGSEVDQVTYNLFFAVADETAPGKNSYEIQAGPRFDHVVLYYNDSNGNRTVLDIATNASWPTGEWWVWEFDWTAGNKIKVTLKNQSGTALATVSETDDSRTSGGIGFGRNCGNNNQTLHYWDQATLDTVSTGGGSSSLVEDFEDQDLAEFTKNGTYTSTLKSDDSIQGEYLYEQSASSGNNGSLTSLPGDGLPNYPSQGDRFRSYFKFTQNNNSDCALLFGVQQHETVPPCYFAYARDGDDTLKIALKTSNNWSILASTSVTYSQGTLYYFDVTWQTSDDITLTLGEVNASNIATISATDGTHTSGGIAYYVNDNGNGGTTVEHDYTTIF